MKTLFQRAKLGVSACSIQPMPALAENLSSAKYFAKKFANMYEDHDMLNSILVKLETPYYSG
jgi:hypothetical protein